MTRFSLKVLLPLFTFCLMLSCANEGENTTPTSPTVKSKSSSSLDMYNYSDRTGGIYKITADSIFFNPVTVILKSKAKYDSGSPVRVGLSKTQYAEIQEVLDNAFADKGSQLEQRVKHSSAIALFRPRQARQKCILAPDSDSQLKVENTLKKLTGQEQ